MNDPRVMPLQLDVTDPASITRAADRAVGVQVVVNIAGIASATSVLECDTTDAVRLELAPRGIQVVSVHTAQVDTDLTAGSTAPKSDPAVIAAQILEGVEAGAVEVIADDLSREVRRSLPDPGEAQLARFAPHAADLRPHPATTDDPPRAETTRHRVPDIKNHERTSS